GGFDVEHQKAIDVPDACILVEVCGQQSRVLRAGAAIAAYVQVPAFFGGNDAKIFRLGLGAFPDTTRNGTFDLMRGTDSFVAMLYFQGEAHRILYPESTPGSAHTAFNGAKGFSVGVAAFKSGIGQF